MNELPGTITRIVTKAILIVLFPSIIFASACDPASGSGMGISTTDLGQIVVVISPCDDDFAITEATVYRVHGQVYADADDDVLWKIRSDSMTVRSLILGELPAGFTETVKFEQPEPTDRVAVTLKPRSSRYDNAFRPGDLSLDYFLVADKKICAKSF